MSRLLSITKYFPVELLSFYRTKEAGKPRKKPFPFNKVLQLICFSVYLWTFFFVITFLSPHEMFFFQG